MSILPQEKPLGWARHHYHCPCDLTVVWWASVRVQVVGESRSPERDFEAPTSWGQDRALPLPHPITDYICSETLGGFLHMLGPKILVFNLTDQRLQGTARIFRWSFQRENKYRKGFTQNPRGNQCLNMEPTEHSCFSIQFFRYCKKVHVHTT